MRSARYSCVFQAAPCAVARPAVRARCAATRPFSRAPAASGAVTRPPSPSTWRTNRTPTTTARSRSACAHDTPRACKTSAEPRPRPARAPPRCWWRTRPPPACRRARCPSTTPSVLARPSWTSSCAGCAEPLRSCGKSALRNA